MGDQGVMISLATSQPPGESDMVPKGISSNHAAVTRILQNGFDAIAEYDPAGSLVGSAGGLSTELAWAQVASLAMTGRDQAAAQRATAIALDGMLVAVLGIEGGGTLLAIAERAVVGEAADQVAAALDQALADVLGTNWAPWVIGGAAAAAAWLFFRGR